jgi:FdhE protein
MPGTSFSLRTDPATRLAELERTRPEWQGWLRLLEEVARATSDESRPVVTREPSVDGPEGEDRAAGAPLIHRRRLEVDITELQRLIVRLVKKASELESGGSLQRYRPTREGAVELIAAAVRQDRAAILAIAATQEVDPGALGSIAHLAALPLLHACGRELQDRTPESWPYGYCPTCAAWPILAEQRGLDRSRRLRCGRCAGEWEAEWLTCVYCGERDHQRLGSLVLEDGEMLKVETCASCQGYLKSMATLQAIPPFELLLRDLETVELDLVSVERGYCRPAKLSFALDVRILDHASR